MTTGYEGFALVQLVAYIIMWESSPDMDVSEMLQIGMVIERRAYDENEKGTEDFATGMRSLCLDDGKFSCLTAKVPDVVEWDNIKWRTAQRLAASVCRQEFSRESCRFDRFFAGPVPKDLPDGTLLEHYGKTWFWETAR